jgi:signal transduction histidine kinase
MLDGTILESEHDKYLEIVLSESQRLTKLVNTLLDLSKYESGQRPLNKTAFDVNNLLLTVLFKFEQRIENKGIDVNIDFTDPQCFVRADTDQITQVATNLVDNAVKFTPEDGKLTLHTHSAGKQAVVTVQDTGIGISAEDLPYIFDQFYKADKVHTSGMGTGLGLSIVKKILVQHGQDITCSSGPSGTSFTFTLEKAPSPEEARPAEPTQDRPPRE